MWYVLQSEQFEIQEWESALKIIQLCYSMVMVYNNKLTVSLSGYNIYPISRNVPY